MRYGDTVAVDGLSLTVERGTITAVLGANGAGKTTTLRALCNMIRVSGEVRLAGERVPVTRTEFQLLCELADHPGRVLSRQQLLQRVWGYDGGDERLVDVHVGRLRQKIEADSSAPKHLVTVRGLGYKLER